MRAQGEAQANSQRCLTGFVCSLNVPVMSRRSTDQKKLDERRFPVRVRVAIPGEGFGTQLDEMHRWLRREVGLYRYATHGSSTPEQDAVAYYFHDTDAADRFVQEFGLELVSKIDERATNRS